MVVGTTMHGILQSSIDLQFHNWPAGPWHQAMASGHGHGSEPAWVHTEVKLKAERSSI